MTLRKTLLALALGAIAFLGNAGTASANDWGRFYHYPYSYMPFNYRKPFDSKDFDTQYGYPAYPQYMSFPPYYRKDLYYPYLKQMKPGNRPLRHYQGNHYVLDVF
jgi:hypothetical protein